MFYSLRGKNIYTDAGSIAVECGGIAFSCNVSAYTLRQCGRTGDEVLLFTYMAVREDAVELFGFATKEELECFKLLISVSGVGPRGALAILSQHTPDTLSLAIASGDVKSITLAQGIGPKIAQRIVLELKGKMAKRVPDSVSASGLAATAAVTPGSNAAEAAAALSSLGFTGAEASRAVSMLDPSLSVEALIREALKLLSKGI